MDDSNEMNRLGKETEWVEYKKSTGEMKEAIISIAAILNKHGEGKLYFGVRNDGTILGQIVSEDTLRSISQAIRYHITPTIYPMIQEQTIGKKTVILVEFSGSGAPYLAYNIPRIRVADEDLVMEQPMYQELLHKRESVTWSWERQKSQYLVADIDPEIFKTYMRKARLAGRIDFDSEDPGEVMTKLELSDGEVLLNAGAALFVNSGMNELQMAKFASDERLTFTDIRRYTGSILELADKAVQYVIDAMDWRVAFDGGLSRKEIPEIPVAAVREAVINAFGHRVIESGQSVEVAVYRSFIDIYSPGAFPDGVTPEAFIREARKPIRRNPLITRTLYYSKDMESFATGLKRIWSECEETGCRVEFNGDQYGFTVRFCRHCGEGWEDFAASADESDILKQDGTRNGTRNGSSGGMLPDDTEPAEQNSGREERILEMIRRNDRITREQMASELSVSLRTIQRILQTLDQVEYVGKGKNGHWTIKGD